MLKDVIDAGGSGLLIPAVLFALVVYLARGLFELHGRRTQQRKDFLERWDKTRLDDDLWLEVAVRQLFGTYLPAHVIRLALTQRGSAYALLELSELWSALSLDPISGQVRWKKVGSGGRMRRALRRHAPFARYLFLASGSAVSALVAYGSDNPLAQWVYALLALVLVGWAMISLDQHDSTKIAEDAGDAWITRINAWTGSGEVRAAGKRKAA